MAPSILSNSSLLLADAVVERKSTDFGTPIPKKIHKRKPYFQTDIVWKNVAIMTSLHLFALYGAYLMVTRQASIFTFILSYAYGSLGGMGITAGAHRLWAHRSYRANYKLRIVLCIANLIAFQNSIFEWVRDHRVHHKFTDTDADPHNSRRGFFFSHVGWLLVRKHPDVLRKGATIDMSDLERDPIVMFQKKYYLLLMPTFCFIIPTLMPMYILNETLWNSWFVASALRYVLTLNATWLVNSAAHKWGTKPLDRTIPPSNNVFVAVAAFGEGFHNYHHVFPWDYKTSELGDYSMNFSTGFIDFFAKIGWAFDLKTASKEIIERRSIRTGDGTRQKSADISKCSTEEADVNSNIWGWNDVDMDVDDKKCVTIINRIENDK
ncbi:acyl-CoA Delta-9 desaturase-like [Sitodiplosis mosellana]|uniref:acyl-CoA Delta-9 desaturase-like n=1 Tax=Sitodiplosis mosellana TaxID=263140 RepID=UPI002445362F|nr:acyl-CoA Delta-9 desaturase-like [Sitodiplosis mosellana]